MTAITATGWPPGGPAAGGGVAPGSAFATVLAGHLGTVAGGPNAAAWPTVTLGEMLAGVQPPTGPPAAASLGHVSLAPAPGALALASPPGALAAASTLGHVSPAATPGDLAVAAAQRYLGVPYLWGGTDPATGLDCSGLVQRVYADLGVDLPRVSADQARAGVAVGSSDVARPGDLVFWRGAPGRPNHIGLYIGGGHMIHAPRTGEVVRIDPVRAAAPDAIRRIL